MGKVHTVLGTMSSMDLGVVLPHEHILIALTNWHMDTDDMSAQQAVSLDNLARVRRRQYENLDNLIVSDLEMQKREVDLFRQAGGNTIVDLTLHAIGRDVGGLAQVSKATGVNVIAGCGYYVHTAHPPEIDRMTVADIAEVIIRDLTEGIDGTNIKAGVIGEIGTWDPIQPNEEKVLRGVAEAHRKTGAPIVVHTYLFAKWGMQVLDILEQEGVPPERVALAHVDSILSDLDYHRAMADRGAYLEYDLFGAEGGNDDWRDQDRGTRLIPPIPCDMERIRAVKQLLDGGYGDRLLASQDVCMKVALTSYGGYGYAHILQNMLPLMRDVDISESQIRDLIEVNPQRFLGWG